MKKGTCEQCGKEGHLPAKGLCPSCYEKDRKLRAAFDESRAKEKTAPEIGEERLGVTVKPAGCQGPASPGLVISVQIAGQEIYRQELPVTVRVERA